MEDARSRAGGSLGYQPALDGVRAVAIALVVCWHAFGYPVGGFLGVHVFFALSGFLITTLLLQERRKRGKISLRHFYLRRALRLLPALAVMLAAYTATQAARSALQPGSLDFSTSLKGVAYSAFYISNIVQAAGVVLGVPVSHLWSLATEEQFYVLWPCLLVVALRLGAGGRRLALLLGVLVAAVALDRLALTLDGASRRRLYFAPDTTFDPILIGCLAGIWFSARGQRGSALLRRVGLPAWALVAVLVATIDIESRALYAGLMLVFGIASGLIVLSLVAAERPPFARVLASPPAVFGGRISYSLYLWHPMILELVRKAGLPAVAGVVFSVAVAAASYRFVEVPFLRRKRRDRDVVEGRRPAPALEPSS